MATKKTASDKETITRTVRLVGTADLMFDRYPGNNDIKLEWYQKLYFAEDGKSLIFPAINLTSFLSSHNTNSAPKRLLDKRKYKDVANACLSFVSFSPLQIPIMRNGLQIRMGPVISDKDMVSGVYLHRSVARLDKGIPNPKERPVIPLPWSLEFTLSIFPNKEIQEELIRQLFEDGGRALGLGTFRGVFGKFIVDCWV